MPTPSSTPSSTPTSTVSTRRSTRKRLSAILACSAISPTLDILDFSMIHAQLSDTPKSSIFAHRTSEEEFTSFELIPLRNLSRGRDAFHREPIPFFANATQNIDDISSPTEKRTTPAITITRTCSTGSFNLASSLESPSAIDARTASIAARPS